MMSLLVLPTGSFQRGRVEDIEAAQFEETWKANCMGAFLTTKEVWARCQIRRVRLITPVARAGAPCHARAQVRLHHLYGSHSRNAGQRWLLLSFRGQVWAPLASSDPGTRKPCVAQGACCACHHRRHGESGRAVLLPRAVVWAGKGGSLHVWL